MSKFAVLISDEGIDHLISTLTASRRPNPNMQAINKLSNGTCTVSFYSVEPCLGDARVTGWVKGPTRDEAFAYSGQVAQKLGRKHLGGICLADVDVDYCFQFDVQPQYLPRKGRYEFKDEVVQRVTRQIKSLGA